MRIEVSHLDHLVLTVADVERSVDFYVRALGMEAVTFGGGRRALRFGNSKINLHSWGDEIAPHAARPQPGSADLCFVVKERLDLLAEGLRERGVEIILGPVRRTGARAPLLSLYLRDPDGNLIELSNELGEEVSGG